MERTFAADELDQERAAHAARGARFAEIWGWGLKLMVAALFAALVVRTFVAQPFAIPSSSMAPGLQPGDLVLVNKAAFGWSAARFPFTSWAATEGERPADAFQAGDVIVFAGPGGQDFVKRVVALPGQTVEARGGQLVIDGTPVVCTPAGDGLCRERLPGSRRGHLVRPGAPPEVPDGLWTVPVGHLFVLGDNRGDSIDSRLARRDGGLGPVAKLDVTGRASVIFLSIDGRIRWDRIGKRIS